MIRNSSLPKLSVSTLEDVILGFFLETQAAHPEAVLLLDDICKEWTALNLRARDLDEGMKSLIESGICQAIPTEQGTGVQLTTVGATYLNTSGMLGLKFMITRRALRWNVERLRGGARRRATAAPAGRRRREDQTAVTDR